MRHLQKKNIKSEMETLFMTLPLNVQRGSSEEIWPLQGFFTVSLLLMDLHLVINYSSFSGVTNVRCVSN